MKSKMFIKLFICLFILNSAVITNCSAFEKKGVFLKKVYKSNDYRSIPYRFYIPKKNNKKIKYPLILFLHGAGEVGNDNERQLNGFPRNFIDEKNSKEYPCFIIAPQCPDTDTWVKFPNYPSNTKTTKSPTHAARLTIELIEKLIREYNIDEKRIYVIGLSLGGEGTFDIVSRRPDLFAAAVPICGIADTDRANDMKDVPFWIFHGENDDINKADYSHMMFKALKEAGADPKYTEYKNMGHNIWYRVYDEPELLKWMFSQIKN